MVRRIGLGLRVLLLVCAGLVGGVATAQVATSPKGLKPVPRERTVIAVTDGNRGKLYNIWSPYNLGGDHQNGNSLFYEPLYFYDGLGDRSYPWLADSFKFNADYTELTYHLRPGITWSDGVPFTADDVAYTFNTLRDLGGGINNGKQFADALKEAVAVDPQTVRLSFVKPSPKFHDFITYKGDNGVFIVPKHIFQDKKWSEFTNYDPAGGYPVTTGAWRVAFADPSQRIIDRVERCEDWWGCRTGFMPLPKVERFILLTGLSEDQKAQAIISGEADVTRELSVETMKKILADNPQAEAWQGKKPPYGSISWWPTSLVLNNTDKHLSKREVRWAISYSIDRAQTIDVAFSGAGSIAKLPWPGFKALQPFTDGIADLTAQYPTDKFDPAKAQALLTGAGYHKDKEGFWADAQGDRIKCDIVGFSIYSDMGPIIAEQLRQQGFDASYSEPPNGFDRINKGDYTCAFNGHTGSSAGDPYLSLALYTTAVPGATNAAQTHNPNNFYRYSNPEFDRIVAELGEVGPNDRPRALELACRDRTR